MHWYNFKNKKKQKLQKDTIMFDKTYKLQFIFFCLKNFARIFDTTSAYTFSQK